jgi:hypothetical protein
VQSQSFKQSFILALIFTLIWGAIGYIWGGQNLLVTAVQLPFFFGVILVTMRATNRITVALTRRFGPKPKPPPEPAAPTTERPDHAQRRRSQRRRRSHNRRN